MPTARHAAAKSSVGAARLAARRYGGLDDAVHAVAGDFGERAIERSEIVRPDGDLRRASR